MEPDSYIIGDLEVIKSSSGVQASKLVCILLEI
jgi:hypothetical protein